MSFRKTSPKKRLNLIHFTKARNKEDYILPRVLAKKYENIKNNDDNNMTEINE